jgi:hypothetical protein
MFKQVAAVILLFAFITQTFSGGLVLVNYYTNTAAFIKNCENKAKPKMHCNGRCQMMKKMQQEEKQDQRNAERKSVNKMDVLSSRSFFASSATALSILSSRAITVEQKYPLTTISYAFFHPPKA